MARTRGGHRPQLRRSSRIRQQSFPKSTSTEPIDLVQSPTTSESDDMTAHIQRNNNYTISQSNKPKIYRRSKNKNKVTAGRPVLHSETDESSEDDLSIADLMRRKQQYNTQNNADKEQQNNYEAEEENEIQSTEDDEEHNDHNNEQIHEDQQQEKIKITKWKRKRKEKDVNPTQKDVKTKIPNVKFPTKKKAKQDSKEIEGPAHLNRAKKELKIRNSTRLFSEMVYYLTDEQKEWVRNSGFEQLLDFCLEMLPSKLGYNILQIFDANTVSLKLKNEIIPITDEDVYDTLGLPHGGESITLGTSDMYQERIYEWSAQFPSKKEQEQVTVSRLVQIMKEQGLTQNFKLNFLIVMSNVLIGTTTYTYVDKQLLRLHGSLDECYRYNWAEFLINYLVSATGNWNQTSSTFFTGSLPFLMLFYVDRVRPRGIKLVERRFPSYKGWTEDKLKQRQSIEIYDRGFGFGTVLKPLREVLSQDTQPIDSPNKNQNQDDVPWDAWKENNEPSQDNEWNQNLDKNQDDVPWDAWNSWSPWKKSDAQNQNNQDNVEWNSWSPWQKSNEQNQKVQDDVEWDHQEVTNIHMEDFQQTQNEPHEQPMLHTLGDEPEQRKDQSQRKQQADGEKSQDNCEPQDMLESLQATAQELIELKMLFDSDLKLALQSDPENPKILMIRDLVNDVFNQKKSDISQENTNPNSIQQEKKTTKINASEDDDDFELQSQDIEQIDLIEFLHSAKTDININHLFAADDREEAIPSFSLGIDENLESDEHCAARVDIDTSFTPKPALREKSQRALRLGRYGKSPFVERVVDMSSKLTNQEFGIWRFMIKKQDPVEQIFSCNDYFCIRDDMQTLKVNNNLATSVIDTWSLLLNDNEKYRADESPLRLFCTIGCVYPTLKEHKSVSTTYPLFADNMNALLKRINRQNIETMDMVFFPMWAYEHFYLVCYNLKNPCYEIIDNIQRDEDVKLCYGPKPKILHSHFTKYLQTKGNVNLAKKIRQMKPTYKKMPWQTKNNSIDCGIFLMRHMETYKGHTNTWQTDLNDEKHGQQTQIIRLRVKYNNAILASQLNEKREDIINAAKHMYVDIASKKLVNFIIQSSQQSQEQDMSASTQAKSQKKKTVTFAKNLSTTFEKAHNMANEV